MKLLVIGHSVLDHIKEPDGFRFQPGGVFYTALALGTLKSSNDSYFLCTLLESAHTQLFALAFDTFDTSYSSYTERIPRVHLTIFNEKERCERFENLNNPVQLPVTDYNQFDGIFINMISGFEINLEMLQSIRSQYQGPIYFDVHSLSRGVGTSLVREHRPIPDFHLWAQCITVLQANEHEIFTLSNPGKSEFEIAKELLYAGVKIVLVTKGENGGTMYRLDNDEILTVNHSALSTTVVNKVGCGDVFGAYFFYHYITHRNAEEAFHTAIIAGGCVTQYKSFSDYIKLTSDVAKYSN